MKSKFFRASILFSTILVLLSLHFVSSEDVDLVDLEDRGQSDLVILKHMFLSPNSSITRSIEKDQVDYYELFVVPTDEMISIFKRSSIGAVDLFLSLDPTNKYPNEKEYTYTTYATELPKKSDIIHLPQHDLKKACDAGSDGVCAIYVAVIPQGTSASYTISNQRMLKKNSIRGFLTLLEDGKKLKYLSLPLKSSLPQIFYFYAPPMKPFYITVKSSCKVAIYAKILERDTNVSSINNTNLPTNSSYDYASYTTEKYPEAVNVTIDPQFSESSMLVAIAVYPEQTPGISNMIYWILLDSQVAPIAFGTHETEIVFAGEYTYLEVNVPFSDSTLLILVKSQDGQKLSLVASKLVLDVRPTVETSKFKERTFNGSTFLQINAQDVSNIDVNKYTYDGIEGDYLGLSDTWVIGVYGKRTSEFTLFTTSINGKIIELKPNQIVTASWTYQDTYFIYEPVTKGPIWIRTKLLPDSNPFYIRQASKDEEFYSNLPNKTNHQWSKTTDIDRDACNNCFYIIAVPGRPDYGNTSSFPIMVYEGEEFREVSPGDNICGDLSPGASQIIFLPYLAGQDIYIAVNSTADKLKLYTSNDSNISTTNYLWNTEIKFKNNEKKIYKIPRKEHNFDPFSIVYLYAKLNNPSSDQVSYSLAVLTEDWQSSHDIVPQGFSAVFFYSKTENEIIEFKSDEVRDIYIGDTISENPYHANYSDLDVKAYYWSEEYSGIPAISVPIFKINISPMKYGYPLKAMWTFKTNSKIGKFMFLLINKASERLLIFPSIFISTKIMTLNSNSEIQASFSGKSHTYQITFSGPGAWYLSGYSCRRERVQLRIENDAKGGEIDAVGTEFVEHSYAMVIGEGETTKVISLTVEEPITEFIFKSVFIPGATTTYDYAYERDGKIWSTAIQDKNISTGIYPLTIISKFDYAHDKLVYEIMVCPKEKDENYYDFRICPRSSCITQKSEDIKIRQESKEQVQLDVIVPKTGTYGIVARAHIKSYGQEVKTFFLTHGLFEVPKLPTPVQIEKKEEIEEKKEIQEESVKRDQLTTPDSSMSSLENPSSSFWSFWAILGIIILIIFALLVMGFISKMCLKISRHGRETELGSMSPLVG